MAAWMRLIFRPDQVCFAPAQRHPSVALALMPTSIAAALTQISFQAPGDIARYSMADRMTCPASAAMRVAREYPNDFRSPFWRGAVLPFRSLYK